MIENPNFVWSPGAGFVGTENKLIAEFYFEITKEAFMKSLVLARDACMDA